MLVLSRKVGQVIVIGGGITLTIASIRGNRISLAIEAPDSVSVDRAEVYLKKRGIIKPTTNTFNRW